jgi:hypothetical protein
VIARKRRAGAIQRARHDRRPLAYCSSRTVPVLDMVADGRSIAAPPIGDSSPNDSGSRCAGSTMYCCNALDPEMALCDPRTMSAHGRRQERSGPALLTLSAVVGDRQRSSRLWAGCEGALIRADGSAAIRYALIAPDVNAALRRDTCRYFFYFPRRSGDDCTERVWRAPLAA